MGLKAVFKTAFPFVAAALGAGGLPATLALGAVGKLLGVENVRPEEVEDKIGEAVAKDPEAMLKLKKMEEDFAVQMKELGIESVEKLEEIAAGDRSNARAREIAVRDKIPAILAISVTVGFFGLLFVIAFCETQTTAHDILLTMIGSLGTAWISIIGYYFGSSAGSAEKTRLLAEASPAPSNVVPFKAAS